MSLQPQHHDPVWTGRRCAQCNGRIQARIAQVIDSPGKRPTAWEVACKRRCIDGSGELLSATQFATEVATFLATVDTIPEADDEVAFAEREERES